ncbi:MAG: serine/threonine protein kinase [Okeania sp. SIO3B3]|nr:serine/threonine protein kinase [Okeania sp. SIO3B3]
MVNMTVHQPNDIIAQRYRIVTALGKGGMGITYEAEDLTNYQRVALKAVSLRQAKDWKILELFEREAKVIANLHHPQIPKYLNYFYIDTEQDRWFYLISELLSGNSLATWIEKGSHPTEIEIKDIAIQILKILSYLHRLNPPIIHRDIKPQNIILQPDGKIYLVDFGAVQDIYRHTMSFSGTFVGTIGYMPPEQLRGKAYSASDLYSLGATLLYLLTHRSPDELPQKRMKIDFRSCVEISPEFADWLEVILEPMWEDRFKSATEALNVLTNKSEMIYTTSFEAKYFHQKPPESLVTMEKTSQSLMINIPPNPGNILGCGCLLPFLFLWWEFLFKDLAIIFLRNIAVETNLLYLIPFMFWILVSLLSLVSTQIKISHNEFLIHWKILVFSRKVRGKTADLCKIAIKKINRKSRKSKQWEECVLFEGVKKHKFGFSLTKKEKEWIVAEISDFLQELKSPNSRKIY